MSDHLPPLVLAMCPQCGREFVVRSWHTLVESQKCGYCLFTQRLPHALSLSVQEVIWLELSKWYAAQASLIRMWCDMRTLEALRELEGREAATDRPLEDDVPF